MTQQQQPYLYEPANGTKLIPIDFFVLQANAVRRGVSAHELDDEKDDY